MHSWQDVIHNNSDTFCVGMNAIGLVQLRISCDSLQEKGIQQNTMLFCKARIDRGEGFCIFAAEIGRRQHACEQDRNAALIEAGKDGGQVCERRAWVQAAQSVVRAELNNRGIGRARWHAAESPVQPREPAGGGVAGHACINDNDIKIGGAKGLLELRRERLVLGKPVSGGEAVAEDEKPHGRLGCGCHGDAESHREHRGPSNGHPSSRVDNREGLSISGRDLAAKALSKRYVVAVKSSW